MDYSRALGRDHSRAFEARCRRPVLAFRNHCDSPFRKCSNPKSPGAVARIASYGILAESLLRLFYYNVTRVSLAFSLELVFNVYFK